jgi:hypothetical protein
VTQSAYAASQLLQWTASEKNGRNDAGGPFADGFSMPLAIAAFAAFSAWAEWRPDFAPPYRLPALVVDAVADIADDNTLFQ